MRHVLGLASSRSPILLRSSFPFGQLSIPISKSIHTSSLLGATEARKLHRATEKDSIKQAGPLFSTTRRDTNIKKQEEYETFTHTPRIVPASVKGSLESEGWKILDPVGNYTLEHLHRAPGTRMLSYIQFITTPTSDTPGTALLLHFDDKRYLIGNAHEGLQRASIQLRARLLQAKDFFLTGRTEWQSNGGLLGMILTLADASISSAASKAEKAKLKLERKRRFQMQEAQRNERRSNGKPGMSRDISQGIPTPAETEPAEEDTTVRLHGGPNLVHLLATARSFIFRKGMPVEVLEHIGEKNVVEEAQEDWEPTWSDSRVHVWAMPIKQFGISEIKDDLKPESPRKRSLGEFMTGERPSQAEILNQWSKPSEPPEDQDEQDRQIREFAVTQMFSSAWSPDNMLETPLRDVKLPAALYVRDPVTKELTRYQGPMPDGPAPVPDINVLVREAWPGALIDRLPPTKRSSTAMSYIIQSHKTRGRFDTAAARAKNVPEGPLWAALATGSSVQSSDGALVTPDMVLGPGRRGSGVAVIDLPSRDYIQDLVNRPEWSAEKVMSGVEAVIWILGAGVSQDKTLRNFIEGLPRIQHIISSPDHCPDYLAMTAAASMAIRHHQVDPARYAIPIHNNAVSSTSSDPSKTGKPEPEALFQNCQPSRRGLKINLQPKFSITEDSVVPHLNTALVARETSPNVLELSQAARQEINSPVVQAEGLSQNLPSPDAEIICLGTGSALPSQYRNVSASLLRVPGYGSYLMDCGENTLGQLKRMYTKSQLAEVLRDLKLIWISHLHADHHLGLTSVVKAWYEEVHGKDEVKRPRPTITEQMLNPAKLLEDGNRLFVVGHGHLTRWLEEYSSIEDFGYDQIVPLVSFHKNMHGIESCNLEWNGTNVGFSATKDPKIKSAIQKATGLSNLASCGVSHCWGAQAVSLTFPTGFKFSYSGDCRPSKDFRDIGKNSTVLLHEATFDDELKGEAEAKKHSTTSEALGVGVAMGARRVILTHFSQRYQEIPSLSALDTRSVELEDAEDIDDPSAGMDQAADAPSPVKPPATMDSTLDSLGDSSRQARTEPQAQSPLSVPDLPSTSPVNAPAQIIASNINPAPRPQLNDVKVCVAFDHMRVKVGDIMHLDRFTPALVELYKDIADADKHSKSAKEAFSDDENDILKEAQAGWAESRRGKTKEEQAEKARKGQVKAARKREKKEKWDKEKSEGEKKKSGEKPAEAVEKIESAAEKMEWEKTRSEEKPVKRAEEMKPVVEKMDGEKRSSEEIPVEEAEETKPVAEKMEAVQ